MLRANGAEVHHQSGLTMKFQMAKNSLFAILLRSPWWASAGLGVVLGLLGAALLPEAYRVAGAL
jgi:restriction system protein